MRSAEIISRVAIAGGLLGTVGAGIDMTTNPGIQVLRDGRATIDKQFDVTTTCNSRSGCESFVKGDNPREKEEKILAEWRKAIKDFENSPLNQEAKQREFADQCIFLTSANIGLGGALATLVQLEEENKEA